MKSRSIDKGREMNKDRDAKMVIWIIAFTQFAIPLMFSGVGVTLPEMAKELSFSAVTMGLVETLYLAGTASLLLSAGRMADITDKIGVFKVGLVLFSLITLIIGFLPTAVSIIIFRFFQGASAALSLSTSIAIVSSVVPREKIGKSIGIILSAIYVGLTVGPFLAGLITSHLGWRWVYFITFIPLAFCCFLTNLTLKGEWKKPTIRFDWIGTFILICSLVLFIVGGSLINISKFSYFLISVGLALFLIFLIIESTVKEPLINPRDLINNSKLSYALMAQMLVYGASFGFPFLFAIYLQIAKELSAASTGLIISIGGLFMAILAPIFGSMADRLSRSKLISAGMLFVLIGAVIGSRIDSDISLYVSCLVFACQGIGMALFSSPNMATIMGSVPSTNSGTASALASVARTFGMVLSIMTVSIQMAVFIGPSPISNANIQAYLTVFTNSFVLYSVYLIFGLLIVIRSSMKKVRQPATMALED